MSSPGGSIPEQEEFTLTHWGMILGATVGMMFLLYIFRYVINICVIDICILGDCTAWKRICVCCCRRDAEEDGTNSGPRPWGVRGALALQTIGAFDDPLGYLYSEELGEEKRKALLEIIVNNEFLILQEGRRLEDIDLDDESNVKAIESSETNEKRADEESQTAPEEVHVEEDERNTCSICLVELGQGSCTTKRCHHSFHQTCIKSWIERSLSCPICRDDILTHDRLRDYMASNRILLTKD